MEVALLGDNGGGADIGPPHCLSPTDQGFAAPVGTELKTKRSGQTESCNLREAARNADRQYA
jgi:hypothetical protein